jgi:benzylsuccinate CoA-transferase BbsE subunit
MGLENAVQFYDLEGVVRKRTAGKQRLAGTGVFRCKDGYIYLMAGGVVGNRFWPITTQWLVDEGVEGAQALADPRWLSQDFLATDEARKIFLDIFNPFVLAHTKQELHEKGRARRIPIAPVYDTSDLEHREQLRHREYFVSTPGPYGTLLRMPGAPYKLSATPWSLRHGAPRLGEHTQEILAQVGATAQSLARIEASGEIQ